MKRKILLFAFIIGVLGIISSVIFVVYTKKQEENTINKYCNEINALLESFNTKTDKTEKLNDYNELNILYDNYINSDKKYPKVTTSYESALSEMRQYFEDYYNQNIQNLTLDLSIVNDRNQINETIISLDNFLNEISSDNILEDISDFENQINSNIENYNNKIDEVTNSYYEGKIAENKIEDLASVSDKKSLNVKIEALNGITTELDLDEFIKEDNKNEFKQTIQSNIEGYTNRVAEIDAAEKAEAERIAQQAVADKNKNKNNGNKNNSSSNNSGSSSSQQTSSSTSSKPASSTKTWTQSIDGETYTAPPNVAELHYAGHGIQLNVTKQCAPRYSDDDPWIVENVLVFWIDHTTGAHYDEWGNRVN